MTDAELQAIRELVARLEEHGPWAAADAVANLLAEVERLRRIPDALAARKREQFSDKKTWRSSGGDYESSAQAGEFAWDAAVKLVRELVRSPVPEKPR